MITLNGTGNRSEHKLEHTEQLTALTELNKGTRESIRFRITTTKTSTTMITSDSSTTSTTTVSLIFKI